MLGLATADSRSLVLKVNSTGCVILVGHDPETAEVVYAGSGKAKVKACVEGATLWVKPLGKELVCDIEVPELRHETAGWCNEPSLTDLEPRPYGTISPEIKAILDQMNRNAIIR